jgi:hypothetical protein
MASEGLRLLLGFTLSFHIYIYIEREREREPYRESFIECMSLREVALH